jgi:hypothetical protein
MTQPTVGRMVHYVSYGTPNGEYTSQCRAAIVTEAGQWVTMETESPNPGTRILTQEFETHTCGLTVLNPTGVFFNSGGVPIRYDATGAQGGTWHWPEGTREAALEGIPS